jgi:hypothetical protein
MRTSLPCRHHHHDLVQVFFPSVSPQFLGTIQYHYNRARSLIAYPACNCFIFCGAFHPTCLLLLPLCLLFLYGILFVIADLIIRTPWSACTIHRLCRCATLTFDACCPCLALASTTVRACLSGRLRGGRRWRSR